MPFRNPLRRRSPNAAVVLSGTRPCSEEGCARQDGVDCTYVDRRRHTCATAWCSDHVRIVDGAPVCRRHESVLRAVPADGAESMPDVDQRALSLLRWVTATIDTDVRELLERQRRPDHKLVAAPPRLTYVGIHRKRVWIQSWKLVDHAGRASLVTLEVPEERDNEVAVSLDGRTLTRLVPPWISARAEGRDMSAEEDSEARAQFEVAVLAALREALGAERAV